MRPITLTLAGAALGVAALLPVARTQLVPGPPTSVQVAPVSTGAVPSAAPVPQRTGPVVGFTVTATGPVVATRYGPVQVQVVVRAGRLVTASSLRLPNADDQSREINRSAGPVLNRQAVATQGQVDTVSGATWTTNGYRTSLQAALDSARAAGLPA